MAASRLPKPGSEYGPCVPECQHRNCAGCGDKIGYERAFYRDDADDLIHATCAESPEVRS